MGYTNEQLNDIYDRTSGYCAHCQKKLAFKNYGKKGSRGAWEVDHSIARAKGGTNSLNNLNPACIQCNRNKGILTARTARRWHGKQRAPLSVKNRRKAKVKNAVAGGIVGGLVGSIFGPWGIALCSSIGARLGYKANPDR